jgi:nitroimidazol reductase NimA-like FMN-containing flavoprotein (pyridoxamine 5'-phosphate oxidase superfamily)
VVVFGTIRIVEDVRAKQRFFDALMAKYGKPDCGRPKHFYPRLDEVTLYAIAPERITGKETPLPAASEQWPAKDRTKSPDARP